ncbi:MAG: phosphate/phosphite/phosphonate ABC transporter substrate-binding protein [Porticoccaceae bacterium]|jgi:hypothetical protein|nr:phosphate/phosphite/phosphonate ABC transporter substrate-binding protein [Porticoccaceae bacterium]
MRLLKISAFFVSVLANISMAIADTYSWEKVFQAPVDETFYSLNDSKNHYDPYSFDHPKEGGIGKRNGTYAWGVTTYKDEIWYGAFVNGWCSVWLNLAGLPNPTKDNVDVYNHLSPANACGISDNERKPVLYNYDTKAKRLSVYKTDNEQFAEDWKNVVAVRAAVTSGNTVFIGGLTSSKPVTGGAFEENEYYFDGIKIFAFNGDTKEYLGVSYFDNLDEIRKMHVLEHPDGGSGMYVSAASHTGKAYLLRWTGNADNVFPKARTYQGFDIVIDSSDYGFIGEFEVYKPEGGEDKIVATTWSSFPAKDTSGGLIISSPLPRQGFTAENSGVMYPLLMLKDFDPDDFMGTTLGGGALSVYKGDVYWGTMELGTAYTRAYFLMEKALEENPESRKQLLNATFARSGHFFKTAIDKENRTKTEMLYGNEYLPVFDRSSKSWVMKKNKWELKPEFGSAGLGYATNNYTWTSTVFCDRLFLGTFDYSGGVEDYALHSKYSRPEYNFLLHDIFEIIQGRGYVAGGDMVVFEDAENPPTVITRNGMGNSHNNGFRNFEVIDGNLYVGTSSDSNIGDNAGYMFYKLKNLNSSSCKK